MGYSVFVMFSFNQKQTKFNLFNPIVEKKSLNGYELNFVYAVVGPNSLQDRAIVPPDAGNVGCSQLSSSPEIALSQRESSCPKSRLLSGSSLHPMSIDGWMRIESMAEEEGTLVSRDNSAGHPRIAEIVAKITIQLALPSPASLTLLRYSSQTLILQNFYMQISESVS